MRPMLLALPFALLPLAVAQAADDHDHHDHDHEHGSLAPHVHGVATLNLALEGKVLEIGLDSPAINLVGFEHQASSDADKAKLAAARATLEKPLALFALPAAAGCKVDDADLDSPLFGDAKHEHEHADHDHDHDHDHDGDDDHDHDHEGAAGHVHSDIEAAYKFSCNAPDQLKGLDLSAFFKEFPGTLKFNVQYTGASGQKGAEVTPANPRFDF